jgi:acetyl esterase/lipase
VVPWLFLAVTLVGAAFTFNAYLPQRRFAPLSVPSFFAGWLTAELSHHHFAWQLAATVVFVAAGALSAWPGWLGLGITLASWVGLFGLAVWARRAGPAVEDALCAGLGQSYRGEIEPDLAAAIEQPLRRGRRVVPLWFGDPDVRVKRGIAFAPEHGFRGQLDVYAPRAGGVRAPVLFQVHGGGWTISHKGHQALPLMHQLARAGWVCVASNYRLSPAATWPDHLIDLKRALAWVRRNIAEYGGDPELVCVTGGSAGGHLSAMLALTANDPEYQPGFEDADTRVAAAVPIYGIYDFTDSRGLHPNGSMRPFLERFVLKRPLATHRRDWEKASPTFRVNPDAPPFFVVHGTHDSLAPVEGARHFVEELRQVSRQPVCYAEIPGAQHAFELFHSLRTRHVVLGIERFLDWVVSREHAGAGLRAGAQAPRLSASANTTSTT